MLAKGEKVRVIGRSKERLDRFAAKGADAFAADVKDREALTKAFDGARAVYAMLSSDPRVEDFRGDQEPSPTLWLLRSRNPAVPLRGMS